MVFNWKLAITSAVVMFLFEWIVLLNLYKRNNKLKIISLIVAPIFIIIAQLITYLLSKSSSRLNIPLLFTVLALIELPLSIYGYELTPNASVIERILVAASVGTVVTLISQLITKMNIINN
jgi:hypothetical protein